MREDSTAAQIEANDIVNKALSAPGDNELLQRSQTLRILRQKINDGENVEITVVNGDSDTSQ
jgi:hypothetical protein